MFGVLFLYGALMAISAVAVLLGIRFLPPRPVYPRVEWDEPA